MTQQPFYIPSPGDCIYRGPGEPLHQGTLTDEHLVPYGLGGNVLFREASCKACAKITAKFEGVVQRTIMGPLRARLNLPTRRKKERPTEFEIPIFDASGLAKNVRLPTGDMPRFFPGFLLPDPPFLRGLPPSDQLEGRFWVGIARTEEVERFVPNDGDRIRLYRMRPHCFAQMLAKIAHSYAIATWGTGSFRPFLLDLILGRTTNAFYYIGGQMNVPAPDASGLHMHRPMNVFVEDHVYLGVTVRLFCPAGTPIYRVMVGEALPPLAQEIREASERPGGRTPSVFQ